MIDISVIVPVYNVEMYLDRCVHSIVNQTFKNWELILVDDGSMDNSGKMCDGWQDIDSRIHVIHKENGGLSSARNAGLDVAKGKYITFIDSDDWVELDTLQYLYDLIIDYNADFSMASNRRTNGKDNYEGTDENEIITLLSQSDFLLRLFKIGTQVNVQYAWAKLYKRELFDEIRYPLGLTSEDVPTTFQIALKSETIVCSSKVVYNYFINDKSITGKKFTQLTFDLIKIWDLVCDYANKYADDEIIQYAQLNRARIDFSILMIMGIDISKKEILIYRVEIKNLKRNLRKNMKLLLNSSIPLSRKVLMISFSVSVLFTFMLIRLIFEFIKPNMC